MKRIFKRILSIILCVTMLITSVISLGLVSAETVTKYGTMVEYVTDASGKRRGINSIIIDGVTYYDVENGSSTIDTDKISEIDFYKKALTAQYGGRSALQMWSNIASLIYESVDSDFLGGKHLGLLGLYFDDICTKDSGFGIDLIKDFSSGQKYWESYKFDDRTITNSSTGLGYASNFKSVQYDMAKQVVDKYKGEDFSSNPEWVSAYLEIMTGSKDGFDLLSDVNDTTIVYNIVASLVGEEGTGLGNLYCIAFYDFEVVPIIDNGLEYVNAADGYSSLEDASMTENGVRYSNSVNSVHTSYINNPSLSESTATIAYSETSSASISSSVEASKSYSFGENKSASTGIGMSFSDIININASISSGITTEEVISTAFSNESVESKGVTNETSAEVVLPAHSRLGVRQQTGSTVAFLDYNCPVYVTYKVAILSMGMYYLYGAIESSGFCTIFGTENVIGGMNAIDNLYNRAIQFKDTDGYEKNQGKSEGICNYKQDDFKYFSTINWNTFIDSTQNNGTASARECINHLKNNAPLSAAGATLSIDSSSITTEIAGITPLYDLDSVKVVDSAAYNLAVGNSLDLSKVATAGYNVHSVPYYGYISGGGTWKLCDVNGNVVDSVEGASISDISGNQIFNAEKEGTYYLKFFIDENLYSRVNEEDVKIKNSDLSVQPVLIIKATRTEDGSHECTVGSWRTSIPATCSTEGEKCSYCSICGVLMETKPIEKLAHIEVEAETPATCKSDGVIKTTCGACGTVISTKNLPKISHTLGAWNITAQATCTRTGEKQQTCSSCGEVINTEIIPALGHTEGVWVQTLNATCTEDGVETLSCTSCGYVIDVRPILSTGHDEGVWKIDFEATPEHEGQKTRYCSKCNEALETQAFEKHEHTEGYRATVVTPTCTAKGEGGIYCGECGAMYDTYEIAAAGHDEGTWVISKDATCVSEGEEALICTACEGVIGTRKISVKGHVKGISIETKAPTCTASGELTSYCECCGAAVETIPVNAQGHDGGIWKIDFEATSEHDGQKSKYCSKCGEVLETASFKKHEHTEGYRATVVAPTCTAKGEGGIYCGECGAVYGTYEISETGHGNGVWVVSIAAMCETAGEEICVCEVCSETIGKREINALGHNEGVSVIAVQPTCVTDGERISKCTRCSSVCGVYKINKLNHNNSEWHTLNDGIHSRICLNCKTEEVNNCRYNSVITAPTCVSGGYTTNTCSVCSYKFIDESTEMLGHEWSEWKNNGNGHTRECIRNGCNAAESNEHNWGEWIDNGDESVSENGTKTRICVDCSASETVEAEYSSQFWQVFRPIIVFAGNFVHKIIYLLSLNWLFPEITIPQ